MFPLVTDLPGYQVVTSLGLFRVFRVDVVNVFCMAQFLETESINCLLSRSPFPFVYLWS